MPLTASSVTRVDDPDGDAFLTLDTGAGVKAQGMALVDDTGGHAGVAGNPLVVGQTEPTRYNSAALERQATAAAVPAVLRRLLVVTDTGTPLRYLQVHDLAAPVSGAEVPVFRTIIPAAGQVLIEFPGGYTLAVGCVIAISSTLATWTDPAGDEAVIYAELD